MIELELLPPAPIVVEVTQLGDEVQQALAGKANLAHSHPISSVTGLQQALEQKDSLIDGAMTAHLNALDPHPQYATDSDLAAHATGTGAGGHLPGMGITNLHVSSSAAIAWSKVDKSGATADQVGAAPSSHVTATGNGAHLPATGITNTHVASGAAIEWSKINKTGATGADLGLGSAANQPASAFATASQGAKADTALQPSAIGASVQAYDADLQSIAALTTASFGRNLLTLANAAASRRTVLEVDQQLGATKPTTRSDGTALQTGDRWHDTGDRLWFYWHGSQWLSETLYTLDSNFGTLSATTIGACLPTSTAYNIFTVKLAASARFVTGTYDVDNTWRVQLLRSQLTTFNTLATLNLRETPASATENGFYEMSVAALRDVVSISILYLRLDAIKTGNPPNIERFNVQLTYRLAKP